MPKKKIKNKNYPSIETIAKTILANTQKAFYFGANNKGKTPIYSLQAKFIQEKIDALINKNSFFEKKLKKIPLKQHKEIKELRQKNKEEKCILSGLTLLGFFYNTSDLKKQFEVQNEVKWNDEWLKDLKDLKIIWATALLDQYRQNKLAIFSNEELTTYDKLRVEGVSDQKNDRITYFKRTFFDIQAATLYGVAACEIMAEFALFEAIRLSITSSIPIYYIRFLSEEYEEINAIALGNWPNEDSLIVCPWLGKGENLIWKKDLQTTRFSNYSETKIKTILRISDDEMDKWRKALKKVDFLTVTEEKQAIRTRIEEMSKQYQKAFIISFPENNMKDNNFLVKKMNR